MANTVLHPETHEARCPQRNAAEQSSVLAQRCTANECRTISSVQTDEHKAQGFQSGRADAKTDSPIGPCLPSGEGRCKADHDGCRHLPTCKHAVMISHSVRHSTLASACLSQGACPNFVSRFRTSEPKFRPKFRDFVAKNC